MCSAEQIVEFYRRATEAGKFSKGSTNPVKKREFKEIERRWLAIARECKCNGGKEVQKPSRRCNHAPRRKR